MPAPLIMVLEDHPILRQSTAIALQTLSHEHILMAFDGLDALQQLRRSGGIDIAICDIRMPGMDGMTFLRIAAQERLIRAVILVSEVSEELRQAMPCLADMHGLQVLRELGKPVCIPTLAEQINAFRQIDRIEIPAPALNLPDAEIMRGFRNDEFNIYIQPKIELKTQTEHSAEVLTRLHHIEYGTLSPAQFIDQIRNQKLQHEITRTVLEKSLQIIESEHLARRAIAMSINLEIADLQNPDLISHIDRRIRHYRVPASALTFEVTEGEQDRSPAISLEPLIRLRLMGCGVSIDDFGAGYSSLQRLCDTPCSELKLDASFVRRMKSNLRAREAIASTVSLARHLGLLVVAEGIETQGQLRMLQALGCDAGQGYLFAPPMPSENYLQWRSIRLGSTTTAASRDIR
ncbi:EAL domain-containing response regulator [Pseudomonas sp. ZM23]|uniref:EAL domain-containing response regulator n=1 Tax=Pseudomonas triclosanedens TaxID=2961893 RepID=A0ABY6ZT87_9PSED|nr:EAL domain-containing response regulator [Pseudomonas triclosanedens]MCP8466655.1 EAL domain-containing response regulator [Pseudomonas triclosanedens]MCP8471990.1 EAL domain-containing response regulator [Pseudomonas triclosanedens]MCP8474626.1 EAL domain-containing response regulator [Pseudomonas triclosanedens]WAI47999.1 EAL domain-containing response regulator [Pseudomonas triclosanedens]